MSREVALIAPRFGALVTGFIVAFSPMLTIARHTPHD